MTIAIDKIRRAVATELGHMRKSFSLPFESTDVEISNIRQDDSDLIIEISNTVNIERNAKKSKYPFISQYEGSYVTDCKATSYNECLNKYHSEDFLNEYIEKAQKNGVRCELDLNGLGLDNNSTVFYWRMITIRVPATRLKTPMVKVAL